MLEERPESDLDAPAYRPSLRQRRIFESRYREALAQALKEDAEECCEHLIVHAIKEARQDNTLLGKILDKILPSLKSIEANIDSVSPFQLVIDVGPRIGPGHPAKVIESEDVEAIPVLKVPINKLIKARKTKKTKKAKKEKK